MLLFCSKIFSNKDSTILASLAMQSQTVVFNRIEQEPDLPVDKFFANSCTQKPKKVKAVY